MGRSKKNSGMRHSGENLFPRHFVGAFFAAAALAVLKCSQPAAAQTFEDLLKYDPSVICDGDMTEASTPYGVRFTRPDDVMPHYYVSETGQDTAIGQASLFCTPPAAQWMLYPNLSVQQSPDGGVNFEFSLKNPREPGTVDFKALKTHLRHALGNDKVKDQVKIFKKTAPSGEVIEYGFRTKPGFGFDVMDKITNRLEKNIHGGNTEHLCPIVSMICDYRKFRDESRDEISHRPVFVQM